MKIDTAKAVKSVVEAKLSRFVGSIVPNLKKDI